MQGIKKFLVDENGFNHERVTKVSTPGTGRQTTRREGCQPPHKVGW